MDKSKINGIEIVDAKGSVLHMIKSSSPEFKNFGECYISEINYNSIKGWKLHSKQTQNISVPSGKIKMVLYDFREDSSTFNQLIKIVTNNNLFFYYKFYNKKIINFLLLKLYLDVFFSK